MQLRLLAYRTVINAGMALQFNKDFLCLCIFTFHSEVEVVLFYDRGYRANYVYGKG